MPREIRRGKKCATGPSHAWIGTMYRKNRNVSVIHSLPGPKPVGYFYCDELVPGDIPAKCFELPMKPPGIGAVCAAAMAELLRRWR